MQRSSLFFTANFCFLARLQIFPPEEIKKSSRGNKKSCRVVLKRLSRQDCSKVLFHADFINEEERRLTLS